MKAFYTKSFLPILILVCFVQTGFYAKAKLSSLNYYPCVTPTFTANPSSFVSLDFEAIKDDKKVNLSWSTSNEKKIDYFAIQRSKDGVKFQTFAMTKGAGNANSIIEYNEVDYNPYPGISYYRMKQTDGDGKISYSPVISVSYHFGAEGHGISVSPNPNEGEFEIDLTQVISEEILVVIKDIAGKEIFSKVMLKKEGKSLIVVDSENKLSTGVYIVMASSRNELYSQKIIVK